MRLFLSYAASDKPFTDELKFHVQRMGVEVFDPIQVPSDVTWSDYVRQGLAGSDAIVLIAPEQGAPGSNNAFFEAGAASALGKPVLTVVPHHSSGRDIPSELRQRSIFQAARQPADLLARRVVSALNAAA